jgi:hypothetical protein
VSSFPSLLQSAEDARHGRLTRQECQDTWNPRLSAWLVAHKCATAQERFDASVNWHIKRLVREAEERLRNKTSKEHWEAA